LNNLKLKENIIDEEEEERKKKWNYLAWIWNRRESIWNVGHGQFGICIFSFMLLII